jgi:hypothetical protein
MSTALKHILRISGTEAALSSGATKLKNGQCGITTDTKKFVYMDLSGTFHIIGDVNDYDDFDYIGLNMLSSGNYPTAAAGKCRIFYGDDGQLRIQHPAGSPEIIVTTAPGSDGL